MIQFSHYGVHELDSGVRYLAQGRQILTALDVEIDIDVGKPGFLPCPHRINLSNRLGAPLPKDPLIDMFLPKPTDQRGMVYLSDTRSNQELVRQLHRLSSPTVAARWTTLTEVMPKQSRFTRTNIQPVIVAGYNPKSPQRLDAIISSSMSLMNMVVALLPSWLAKTMAGYIEPKISAGDLSHLPLEQIGAHHLYRYLRYENENDT